MSTPTLAPTRTATPIALLAGAAAGPLYVVVSLAQALTREGFDLSRHAWSLLANGDLGWIQIANFALTGILLIAFALGLRRRLAGGVGRRWAPILIGTFGVGMALSATVFRADPALGFPPGTPAHPPLTWQGAVHYPLAAVAFLALIASTFVLARRYRRSGNRAMSTWSLLAGTAFLLSFAAISTAGGAPWSVLTFVAGIVTIFTWLTTVAAHEIKE